MLATDARHDNSENGDVQGEGNCGGGGSGDGGGDKGDNDNDKGGGDNDDDGSDKDDNGGCDNNDDSSDGDDNGGNGGDCGGGCDTTKAAGIDTDNNQLKAAMDNGRGWPKGGGRVHDRRRPWFPAATSL